MTIIRPQFRTHALNDLGKERSAAVRQLLSETLDQLEVLVGDKPSNARELSIVRTKIEEAGMFAQKALSLNPANIVSDEG